MIREDRFLISHRPYAVDLNSLTITDRSERWDGTPISTAALDAVWFRRTRGVTTACVGYLWDVQAVPANAAQFLAQHTDGRYGGRCEGRWDGARYWGAQEPEEIERHLALLRPMLANYPAVPAGWNGWWRF